MSNNRRRKIATVNHCTSIAFLRLHRSTADFVFPPPLQLQIPAVGRWGGRSILLWLFFYYTTTSAACLNNEIDLQSLLAFKQAVVNDSQGALNSWNETVHFCNWEGILCSDRDRVVSIDLMSRGLIGYLSPHIGNLSFLRYITLHNNSFYGQIPEEIGRLRRLEHVTFTNNYFIGDININFRSLSILETLRLTYNNLEGDLSFISSMINCTRLTTISIYGNLVSGLVPDSIANLSSQLGFFSIGRNQLHGRVPSGIGNLHSLTLLSLRENNFEGTIPSTIGKLNKLQVVYLYGNKFTGEIPSSFGNLTLVNTLHIRQNDLYGNIPRSLSNCTNMLNFDVSHNNLNGSIPPEIMMLSSISIMFNLSYNSLTGSIPLEIGSLIHLAKLDLSHNRLSGSVPNSLSTCLSVEKIHLESNSFTGEIPDGLRTLRGLQYLDLSENNMSGPIPRFLSELALLYLNLSYNMLQGEVPTLGVFQNESEFFVEGNTELCGGIAHLNLVSCSSTSSQKKHFSTVLKILISLASGAIFIIFSTCYFYIFLYRKPVSKNTQSSLLPLETEYLRLSYVELLKATDGFSEANILGAGSSGTVYKGTFDDDSVRTHVAVKVINLNSKGDSKSFLSECNALRGIRHRNLVKIMNVCCTTDSQGKYFKALVYEFKANGNLDEWLHKKCEADGCEGGKTRNLSMIQRLNIAVHIASALEYLHSGTNSTIIHGDLKPSNVLLDENMMAHVGDFGLAKVVSSIFSTQESSSNGIRGTIGYIPPEYGMGSMVSTEGDVYSYGILVLELFTGIRPTDDDKFMGYSNLHDFVKSSLPSQVMEVADPVILHEHGSKMKIEVKKCIVSILEIGVACSMEFPRDRIAMMSDVVNELYKIIG